MKLHAMIAVSVGMLACTTPQESTEVGTAQAAQTPKTSAPAEAGLAIGRDAPDFTLKNHQGKEVTLSAFKGKTVVLEWFNPECPFVVYAHGEGPLKDMAKRHQDVVWLAINSNAPGKQGSGVELNKEAMARWGMQHELLFDEDGRVGKLYNAKTTPHMYVIDGEGKLAYMGALDNAPLGDIRGDQLSPYTESALSAVAAGKAPEPSQTTPYGCSVKYLN